MNDDQHSLITSLGVQEEGLAAGGQTVRNREAPLTEVT
jgi:hypothetical protein